MKSLTNKPHCGINELLEACKQTIIDIDNVIARNPMLVTPLPECRAILKQAINNAEERTT